MGRYFSFQKFISVWFVQVIYFVGFLLITAGGIALTVWAGLGLRDATISRRLGWQYVAAGVGALIVGNILWRVICELWIVLFNVHDELVAIRHTIMPAPNATVTYESTAEADDVRERTVADLPRSVALNEPHESRRGASVLGLT